MTDAWSERARLPADDALASAQTLDEGAPNNFEDKAKTYRPSSSPFPGKPAPRSRRWQKVSPRQQKPALVTLTAGVIKRNKGTVVSPFPRLRLRSTPPIFEFCARKRGFCPQQKFGTLFFPLLCMDVCVCDVFVCLSFSPVCLFLQVPTVHTRKRSTRLLACLEFEHQLFVSKSKCKRSCILVFIKDAGRQSIQKGDLVRVPMDGLCQQT